MFVNRKSLYTTGICSRCGRVQFLAFRDDKFSIDHWSPLSHRGCDPATIPLHAMFDYISMLVRTFTLRNFEYETGRLYCPQSVRYPKAIVQRILSSGIFFWLGFRGPDCNVNAGHGGGSDARPSRAGTGLRPRVCTTLCYTDRKRLGRNRYIISRKCWNGQNRWPQK